MMFSFEYLKFINFFFEDNFYPTDLKYKNGSIIEIHVFDPNPTNNEILVKCENATFEGNECGYFEFRKNLTKSTNKNWFGTLRVLKSLNYLEKSIYQIVAVAQNTEKQISKMGYEIKILPNINKAPVLSDNSKLFYIYENQPQVENILLNFFSNFILIFKNLFSLQLLAN
jgi:hypothetical protein